MRSNFVSGFIFIFFIGAIVLLAIANYLEHLHLSETSLLSVKAILAFILISIPPLLIIGRNSRGETKLEELGGVINHIIFLLLKKINTTSFLITIIFLLAIYILWK